MIDRIGRLQGNVITLDEAIPDLSGKRVRVVIETIDEPITTIDVEENIDPVASEWARLYPLGAEDDFDDDYATWSRGQLGE